MQKFYYQDVDKKDFSGSKILDYAENVAKQAKIAKQKNPLKRYIMQIECVNRLREF